MISTRSLRSKFRNHGRGKPLESWTFAGGLAYTLGTYFYHRESVRYSHAIWHLFVLAGSVCHYIAVLALVVPAR